MKTIPTELYTVEHEETLAKTQDELKTPDPADAEEIIKAAIKTNKEKGKKK